MDRPKGSSADDWALWLSEFQPSLPYLAVQIAEAIEDGERRGKPYHPPKVAVCGVDCFSGDALCNGYCNGASDYPPDIESMEANHVDALLKQAREEALREALDIIGTYDENSTCSECCDVVAINEAVTALISEDKTDG